MAGRVCRILPMESAPPRSMSRRLNTITGALDSIPVIRRRVPVTTISSRVRSAGAVKGAAGRSARAPEPTSAGIEINVHAVTRNARVCSSRVAQSARLEMSREIRMAASPSTRLFFECSSKAVVSAADFP